MRAAAGLVALALLLISGCRTNRDDSGMIDPEQSCSSCTIAIESVVTLDGSVLNGAVLTSVRHPTGLFYLRDTGDGLVKVFGSDGRYLRQLGRRGGAPGEYERVRDILVAQDSSIQTLDAMLGRRSVYSPDGRFLSSARIPPLFTGGALGMSAAILPDNRLVVNAANVSRIGTGHVVQVIDTEGNASVLGDSSLIDARRWWLHERLLWALPNGELLVVRPFTFTIDLYGADLTRRRSMTRSADWIPKEDPQLEPSDGRFDRPPTPILRAAWVDSEGLLWLSMLKPATAWAPGPRVDEVWKAGMRSELADSLTQRPRYESILEVVDIEGQQVVARLQTVDQIGMPAGGNYLALYEDSPTDTREVRIVRVRLVRP